jgi:hypothetical protein
MLPISSIRGGGLHRILSSYSLAHFLLDEKIRQNPETLYSPPLWETQTPNSPLNIKVIVPAFFGDRIVEKGGTTHNLAAEEVRVV